MPAYTEEDIKQKLITPALIKAGWDLDTQIQFEYYFTDGQVIVRGGSVKRGKRKFADYILNYKLNFPIAIIEAKDSKSTSRDGIQQALEYANILDIPFVYSSNGQSFIEHDRKTGKEKELSLAQFPSPQELFDRLTNQENLSHAQRQIIETPYYFGNDSKIPRYYQRIAINKTLDAIARGKNRILLVMATGTGKTYTAFQIIYKLRRLGIKKKVLYLADRNILIDQPIKNDFKPFGKVIEKVKNKKLDSSYEVYMALYQQLSGEDTFETFKQFKPEFFDLIIVDECHRGSAKDESNWRKILDYFNSATKIGLTATPKETKDISNIEYFGEPIYTYSLKQGIKDGFLAPYKVIRVGLDISLLGWFPEKGKKDIDGYFVEEKLYNDKNFDIDLIIKERERVVAEKITEFLKQTDRFAKTIVFCVDTEHAGRMRQALINANSDLSAENDKYVVRITSKDKTAKKDLEHFIERDTVHPVIAVTSQLLSTGVDSKTCKLIVLDKNINSMTEFKQIIGRGTRLEPDYNKNYFTIMDFRGVTRLFYDAKFDGDAISIYESKQNDPIVPPEEPEDKDNDGDDEEPTKKVCVNGVNVTILVERVQYLDNSGKLITENLIDYSKRNIKEQYATLENFLTVWNNEDKKSEIIENLKERGVLLEELHRAVKDNDNELDDFDLICHIAFDKKPLTRKERAGNVKKKDYLSKYSKDAKKVLNVLLNKYMDYGIDNIEEIRVLTLEDFEQFDGPIGVLKLFGNKDKYKKAIKELAYQIYN
jgi:type I restriction enzyme R subunit